MVEAMAAHAREAQPTAAGGGGGMAAQQQQQQQRTAGIGGGPAGASPAAAPHWWEQAVGRAAVSLLPRRPRAAPLLAELVWTCGRGAGGSLLQLVDELLADRVAALGGRPLPQVRARDLDGVDRGCGWRGVYSGRGLEHARTGDGAEGRGRLCGTLGTCSPQHVTCKPVPPREGRGATGEYVCWGHTDG
eukprot:365929-Chlamydomonas_euryale.AAC.3